MTKPRCDTCAFWYSIEHGDGPSGYGVCQRYPPTKEVSGEALSREVMTENGLDLHYFYETSAWSIITPKSEFCGEHDFFRRMS